MSPRAATASNVLNISLSLDIIGRIAFGHDFGSGESSEAKAISDSWHQDVILGIWYLCAYDIVLINSHLSRSDFCRVPSSDSDRRIPVDQ